MYINRGPFPDHKSKHKRMRFVYGFEAVYFMLEQIMINGRGERNNVMFICA